MRQSVMLGMALLVGAMTIDASAQTRFRSGVFLRHSTGGCIWGFNGAPTGIPQEVDSYNSSRGLTGDRAVSLVQMGWPDNPWDNEWERWHRIFLNRDTIVADIRPILATHKVVMIKSCFPSSSMSGYGSPADTLNWTEKTVMNYKWHWRSFISVMRNHPENFFIVWTNAPLVNTNDNAARLSDQFCRWAKDTLAQGLDPEFGPFPANVYVFDFFHKLADSTGRLPLKYAEGSNDSHPNAAATVLVAPQVVQEMFDAAIVYENLTSTSVLNPVGSPLVMTLGQNFPNPFNPSTAIPFRVDREGQVRVRVFDTLGHVVAVLVDSHLSPGSYQVHWNASTLSSGTYIYRLDAPGHAEAKQAILLK